MRLSAVLPSALLLAAVAAPAQAQRILYWTDSDAGASVLPQAITALQGMTGGLTAHAASSQDDFNTRLASGNYDLAIFGEQSNHVFADSESALVDYLTGGGRLLAATWLGGGLSSLLGATEIVSQNGEAITGSGALFQGIASPVGTVNAGWGVFSQGYAGAAGTDCLATLSSGGCAALSGNGGRSLLLSPLFDSYADGDQGAQFVANGAYLLLGGAPTSTVPEPSTYALLGSGLLLLGGIARRRRRAVA